jgi:hypothetical protein
LAAIIDETRIFFLCKGARRGVQDGVGLEKERDGTGSERVVTGKIARVGKQRRQRRGLLELYSALPWLTPPPSFDETCAVRKWEVVVRK